MAFSRTSLLSVVLIGLLAAFFTLPAGAAERHVPGQYATIQAAIDAAIAGDEVIIATGTYTGDGNRDITFAGKAITVRSTEPDNPAVVAATIIDCEGSPLESHRGFTFNSGEGNDSVLSGLTITKGYQTDGGGIYLSGSSPTISYCVITICLATDSGGGIYCYDSSSPHIYFCTITQTASTGWPDAALVIYSHCNGSIVNECNVSNNECDGIYAEQNNAQIQKCVINGNDTGVYLGSGTVTIEKCDIVGNNTGIRCFYGDEIIRESNISYNRYQGLEIYDGSTTHIENCIILGNQSCGVYCSQAHPTISNCNILNNTYEGVQFTAICVPTFSNTIIRNNGNWEIWSGDISFVSTILVENCNIEGGQAGVSLGSGYSLDWQNNIDADPMFLEADDLHLQAGSPCIDAGTNTPAGGLPVVDIESTPRPLDGNGDMTAVADIGAYEFDPVTPYIRVTPEELTFSCIEGGTAPEPQTLAIRNIGGGTLNWQVLEDCSWLAVDINSGQSSGETDDVQVIIDPAGLSRGEYACELTVTDPTALNNPQVVAVTLKVGGILHVPGDYATIQAAIDDALDNDVIEVADGTWTGTGNRDLDFLGKSITLRSINGPDACIIDCQGTAAQHHRGVIFQNGEEGAVLEGFTITGGFADNGGGIYIQNNNPSINNCRIITNISNGNGGGIYISDSNVILNNCSLLNNMSNSNSGGGIYNNGGDISLYNCIISENNGDGILHSGGGSLIMQDGCITNNNFGRGLNGGINAILENVIISGHPTRGITASNSQLINCMIANNGGGVEGNNLTIRNCHIENNETSSYGAGISCSGTSTISNCVFRDNKSYNEGGAIGSSGNALIENCIIKNNSAYNGGGLYCSYNSVLKNCLFDSNQAQWQGGGVYCVSTNAFPLFVNCTFVNNHSDGYGGAVGIYEAHPTLTNCILWNNSADDGGNQISLRFSSYPSSSIISHSDVQGGQADVYVQDQCALAWGEGMLDVDPGFSLLNYYPTAGSPCIDAGTNTPAGGLPATDLEGVARILDGNNDTAAIVDMGAYEFDPTTPRISRSPMEMAFVIPAGSTEQQTQTLSVQNAGGGVLNWQITEDCPWLSASITGGHSTGEIDTTDIVIDPTGLPEGEYSCLVTITDPAAANNPQTLIVNLRVAYVHQVPAEFATIQAAIDAALDGDVVLVADGTWTGTGNKNLDPDGRAITIRSENGPANCIIDCEGNGRGFYLNSNETAATVIDGFTVKGASSYGGGVYCSSASPAIRNCIFKDNQASYGGGLYGVDSSSIVDNCLFKDNVSSNYGGAVYCGSQGNHHFTNCRFENSHAQYYGGAICSDSSQITFENCRFSDNYTQDHGGAVYGNYSELSFINCLMMDNQAEDYGGVLCLTHSNASLINCTMVNNFAYYAGGAIFTANSASATIENTIIWGNTTTNYGPEQIHLENSSTPTEVTVSYSDIQGGEAGIYRSFGCTVNWLEGAIDTDPRFITAIDYHLMVDSPCLDTGTNTPAGGLPAFDLDGALRPQDGDSNGSAIADMGVYEFDPTVACLLVSPIEVQFTCSPEANPDPQFVHIRNCGGATLFWQITKACPWLQVNPAAGESTGEIDDVALSVNTQGLSFGDYTCEFTIDDPAAANRPQIVTVNLHVARELHVPLEFATIQAAINAAASGDIITIADGVYIGSGNVNVDFLGKQLLVQSENGPAATIIDCDGASYAFRFITNEPARTEIRGFTLRNANSLAIYLQKTSSVIVRDCILTHNYRGVECHDNNELTFINCLIADNNQEGMLQSSSWTGIPTGQATFVNCTIANNGSYGCRFNQLPATFNNCILWENTSGSLQISSNSNVAIAYSCIQNGQSGLSYGSLTWGAGNTQATPHFAGADDYRLCTGSSCIDTGTADSNPAVPAYDLDGNPRPLDGDQNGQTFIDMGAYEHDPAAALLALSIADLSFSAPLGQTPPAQTFTIANGGGGVVAWTASSNQDWCTVAPTTGNSSGEEDTITVTVDPTGLEDRVNAATITIDAPGTFNAPKEISVTLLTNTVLHVPTDEFPDIMAAIASAIDGDIVLVADGVYPGGISFGMKKITVKSENGPDNCIIDGSMSMQGVMFSGETRETVLDGFSIMNCSMGAITIMPGDPTIQNCVIAWNNLEMAGMGAAGIFLWSGSNGYFKNCLVTGNNGSNTMGMPAFTGGIYCGDSSPIFEDCQIVGNYGGDDAPGGVWCAGGNPQFINCVIADNVSGVSGGGIKCDAGSMYLPTTLPCEPEFINCIIEGNSADWAGGGMYCEDATVTLRNCLIAGNDAQTYGGGIFAQNTILNIAGCTFDGNVASFGANLECNLDTQLNLRNSILWNQTPGDSGLSLMYGSVADVAYCNLAGGQTGVDVNTGGILNWDEGNIDSNPSFVLSGYWNGPLWMSGDYHLLDGSPCFNAGDPNFTPLAAETDIDGQRRVHFRIDMGCDEIGYIGDINGDDFVNLEDVAQLANTWLIPCTEPDWCAGCDLNHSGSVDILDLIELSQNWLELYE